MNYSKILEAAILGALEAGKVIQTLSKRELSKEFKKSGTTEASQIVTEADYRSQEIILRYLSPIIDEYDLGLLTEEKDDDLSRERKEYFLAIDPLDGTLSYSRSLPGYSISITLISKVGEPVLAVIYDPYRENLYSSIKGEGVFKNGKSLLPSNKKSVSWVYDRSLLRSPRVEEFREAINNFGSKYSMEVNEIDYGGAVFNALYVLENSPAIYFKPPKKSLGGGAIWDFSGTNLFFNELNSHYISTDSYGKGLLFNRKSIFFNDTGIIYSSNSELFEIIKEIEFD